MNRNRRVGLGNPAPTGVEKGWETQLLRVFRRVGLGNPAPTGVEEKESCYLV